MVGVFFPHVLILETNIHIVAEKKPKKPSPHTYQMGKMLSRKALLESQNISKRRSIFFSPIRMLIQMQILQ